MRELLVVANQTLGGESLLEAVRACIQDGPCRIRIVVPATPLEGHLTWVEGEARAVAQCRLESALVQFRGLGADATGAVGDGNPILAIEDALREGRFDEIVLSTLPPGISKWLRLDLPSRVASRFPLPVTHVVARPEAA